MITKNLKDFSRREEEFYEENFCCDVDLSNAKDETYTAEKILSETTE